LQATALVHEAFLCSLKQKAPWVDSRQLLGFAAQAMRRILINYARARRRLKRGGPEQVRLSIDEVVQVSENHDFDLSQIDEALSMLEKVDARQARIVELRFFGGLSVTEIAKALQLSPATVKRDWSTAKLWLRRQLAL
jgi:RNA polymerase sigma factor (TIGR02999 family)